MKNVRYVLFVKYIASMRM